MAEWKIGDIVARRSYGLDVLFKIVDICNGETEKTAILKAIAYRLQADAPESDLVRQSDEQAEEHKMSALSEVGRKKKGCGKTCLRG